MKRPVMPLLYRGARLSWQCPEIMQPNRAEIQTMSLTYIKRLIFIFFFCTTHVAVGEVFQVGTTAELRAALLAAQGNGANDEIVLSDGVYDITADGNSTLSFYDAEPFQLILRAATTGSAVLDGLGQARVLDIDSSAEVELLIQGLTIRNGKSADGGAGMQLNVQAAVIEQTKFLDNDGPAIAVYGDYSRGETLRIDRCDFRNGRNQPAILHTGYYSPLTVVSSYFENNHGAINARVYYSDATIINSIFVNNTAEGEVSGVNLDGGAQEVKKVQNSLFLEEHSAEQDQKRVALSFNSTTQNKVFNSVFLDAAGIESNHVSEIHNSYIDRAKITGSAFKKDLIFEGVDPKFQSIESLDFTLLAGSDLIDNGTLKGIDLPETDYAGNPRLTGDYIDIGPYESSVPTGGNGNAEKPPIDGPIRVSTLAELRLALNQVVANNQDDVIVLADGVYDTSADGQGKLEYFDNEAFNLTLKSENQGQAILDANGASAVIEVNSTDASSFSLEGVVIRNGNTGSEDAALRLNVKKAEIVDSQFLDNQGGAIYVYGDYGRGEELLVLRSSFLGNAGAPAIRHLGYASPLNVVSSYFEANEGAIHATVYYADASITNSIFVDNTKAGEIGGLLLSGGAQEQKLVTNSLFYERSKDAEETSSPSLVFGGTTKNRIYNSIFLGLAGIRNSSELFEIYNSFIDDALIQGSAFTKDLLFEGIDPGFTDQEALDFKLRGDSPLIDMGFDGEIALYDKDYAENDRKIGEFTDIGPFEALNPSGGNRPVVPDPPGGEVTVSSVKALREALLLVAANGQDDTIVLEDGIYSVLEDELGPFYYFDNEAFHLTLKARNTGQAVLDGGGTERVLELSSLAPTTLELEGLVIRNGQADTGAAGVQVNMQNAVLKDLVFESNTGSAIYAYGDYGRGETISVIGSKFFKNQAGPAVLHQGYYSPLNIESSRFENNEGAVHALVNYSSVAIQNSIFLNNTNGRQKTALDLGAGNRTIFNSLFYEDALDISAEDRTGLILRGGEINSIYNSIFLGSARLVSQGEKFEIYHSYLDLNQASLIHQGVQERVIFEDIHLGFADQASFNFSLTYLSDLINAGSPDEIGLSALDLAGNPRIAGGIVDIGPFESLDLDNDGLVDEIDDDKDGDGYNDGEDAFPLDPTEWLDSDGDGVGDNKDSGLLDSDGDGVIDAEDAFPEDASETLDSDGDGVGDNADLDDDNDGLTDSEEIGRQTDLKAYLSISGDDAYEAYINGQLVAKDENWFVAERVVANLYPGRNVLAIKGINGAGQSPGAVIADVSVGNGRFQSDETFLVSNTLSPRWTKLEGLLTNASPSTSYGAIDSTVWWNRTYDGAYLWDDANFPADSAAEWIWSDDVDNDGVVFFRKTFSLTDPLVSDSDGDGVLDGQDQLPLDPTEQLDIDRDGLGNNTDSDDDNDGIADELDAYPLDASRWRDQISFCERSLPGLVAWWSADEGPENSAGYGHLEPSGTADYAPGLKGSAFRFRGDGVFSTPHREALYFRNNQAFTVEFWFRPESDSQAFMLLKNANYGVRWNGRNFPLDFYNGSYHAGNYREWELGRWYHVALVDDGENAVSLYIDGKLDHLDEGDLRQANRFEGLESGTTFALDIGGWVDGQTNPNIFDGFIDEVAIYRAALSAEQISNLYYAGADGKCANEVVLQESFERPILSAQNFPAFNGYWVNFGTNTEGKTGGQAAYAEQFVGDSGQTWRVTQGNVDLVNLKEWDAADGVQSLDLNGWEQGALATGLSVPRAGNYRFQVALSKHPSIESAVLNTSVDGRMLTGSPFIYEQAATQNDMRYAFVEGVFGIDRAGQVELKLASDVDGSAGPTIDSIRVERIAERDQIGSCTSNHCIEGADFITYYYAVTDALEAFPFDPSHQGNSFSAGGGLSGGEFYFGADEARLATGVSNEERDSMNSAFTEYANNTGGALLLKRGRQVDNGIETSVSGKSLTLQIFSWNGTTIQQSMVQRNKAARIVRPEAGRGDVTANCSHFVLDELIEGLTPLNYGQGVPFVPLFEEEDLARAPVFRDFNRFEICSDTEAKAYDLKVEALDGRGGKLSVPFTLTILAQNEGAGSIEWAVQASADDRDGDGVADNKDDYPDNEAYSRDSDGDGLPDELNPGYEAWASNNPAALIIDFDDDNDGVSDPADKAPTDATIGAFTLTEALERVSDTSLRDCISETTSDEDISKLIELWCHRQQAPVSNLVGLDAFQSISVLHLENNEIVDIAVVANMRSLRTLVLAENGIRDARPIEALAQLVSLDLSGNPLAELPALAALSQLERLWLNGLNLSDLSFLDALPEPSRLIEFQLTKNPGLKDLSHLERFSNLSYLSIYQTGVSDFTVLRSLPRLANLGADSSVLSPVNYLQNLTQLEHLYLLLDGLDSLQPLSTLDLGELIIPQGGGNLVGLEGLESNTRLSRFSLSSPSLVSDLVPLQNLPSLVNVEVLDAKVKTFVNELAVVIQRGGTGTINLSGNPILCSELTRFAAEYPDQSAVLNFDSECVEASENDADGDGVPDRIDAFPDDPAASRDTDLDGDPDDWNEGKGAEDSTSNPTLVLDDDDDNDGVVDAEDAYPRDPNRTIFDIDFDGVADGLDNCPNVSNEDQLDTDDDGRGDACDDDKDGDLCPNEEDAYPLNPARCEKGVQKAIVIAGGGPYASNYLWKATERMAEHAITTLNGQGVEPSNVRYLSSGYGRMYEPDALTTPTEIQHAITDWALESETPDDVLVYLVDHGGFETFETSAKENISAAELDTWLDELQSSITGQVIVIYDACQSGSFVPVLAPTDNQQRLIITSSEEAQRAYFSADGQVSFSFHFWSNFLTGGDIYQAFAASSRAMGVVVDKAQNAQIEADGDGEANNKTDRLLAQSFSFGSGFALASDTPQIGRVSESITLDGEISAKLEAFDVSGASRINRVWALVDDPDEVILELDEAVVLQEIIEFQEVEAGNWVADYADLNIKGTYIFQVFAENEFGQLSIPSSTNPNQILVTQNKGRAPRVGRDSDQDGVLDEQDAFPLDSAYQFDRDRDFIPDQIDPDSDNDGVRDNYNGPDAREGRDSFDVSDITVVDAGEIRRTFHEDLDEDFLTFFGLAGETVEIEVYPLADQISGPDFRLALLDSEGATQLYDGKKLSVDDQLQAEPETISIKLEQTGRYGVATSQVRLSGVPQYITGARSEYAVAIRSDRKSVATTEVSLRIVSPQYQNLSEAWNLGIEVSSNKGVMQSPKLFIMLPDPVSPIGYSESDCVLENKVLACSLIQNSGEFPVIQLVSDVPGVYQLGAYLVQHDSGGFPLKEKMPLSSFVQQFVQVGPDDDADGLPDTYELIRGLDPTRDDASEDLNDDGVTNFDEYLSGVDPILLTLDSDADGYIDLEDAFPLDRNEWQDTDQDGQGNNVDSDDDGDGYEDAEELLLGTNPLDRFSCPGGCFSFDVDLNREAKPLTDGLLVIRFLFGFDGSALIGGAVGDGAERSSASDVFDYLTEVRIGLDIDGDGEAKALTDGLLLIRYLFGFEGEALISGAIGANATRRTAAEIEAYIGERIGGS